MANFDVRGNQIGFLDKRKTKDQATNGQAEIANMQDVATMRARLAVLNSTLYTSATLDKMTINDMVYAIRLLSADAAGI